MKKTIILFGIVSMSMATISCSPDSILGDSSFEIQTNGDNGDNGGGSGTGSIPIKPPPPPPITQP